MHPDVEKINGLLLFLSPVSLVSWSQRVCSLLSAASWGWVLCKKHNGEKHDRLDVTRIRKQLLTNCVGATHFLQYKSIHFGFIRELFALE